MFTSRVGRRVAITVVASAALLVVLPGQVAGAGSARASLCPSCGHNLIANPGAEAGKGANSDDVVKVPRWTQTGGFTAAQYAWAGGGDLSATTPGPKAHGLNYFYGGPDVARSVGAQTVSLASGRVATGHVRYTLSGWLGGYAGQGDYAFLIVRFENAKGATLASAQIGPVTVTQRSGNSELLFRRRSGVVPAATRMLNVRLVMVRTFGADNDGVADNLALVFTSG